MKSKDNVDLKKVRVSSTKLSLDIINKIMLPKVKIVKDNKELEINNVTTNEIDLLIWVALRQDSFGNVRGIYYKDVCLDLNICKQTFYNSIEGLVEKEYIHALNTKDNYWNITILNNMFINSEDDKKSYVNVNKDFLHSFAFKKLRANEKKICLKLLLIDRLEKGFSFTIYPSTIASWIGLKSISLVYTYMENISAFFPSVRKSGMKKHEELFYFKEQSCNAFVSSSKTEKEHHFEHKIKHFCKKFKIAYTIKDLSDLITLIFQYSSKGFGKVYSVICDVLLSKKSIEPRLINSILAGNEISLSFNSISSYLYPLPSSNPNSYIKPTELDISNYIKKFFGIKQNGLNHHD